MNKSKKKKLLFTFNSLRGESDRPASHRKFVFKIVHKLVKNVHSRIAASGLIKPLINNGNNTQGINGSSREGGGVM